MTRGLKGNGAANIMRHLRKIHFPADKNTIITHAEKGPGPDTKRILNLLQGIPDREYHSTTEIVHESALLRRELN